MPGLPTETRLPTDPRFPTDTDSARQAYGEGATREAIESGMARRELLALLAGRDVTEVVPPHPGEAVADYAVRATGELMVRYLAHDTDHTGPLP